MNHPQTTIEPSGLRERLGALREAKPALRMRDYAAELDVSEGELVAACCGAEAVRLEPRWQEFLPALPELGEVMALTRNETAVHEKDGAFAHIGFFGSMAQVVNHDIDLRIFLRHWQHLFAVEQASHGRTMLSFQVFDGSGTAVHKVFLRPNSNVEAYRAIVERFQSADQTPVLVVEPPIPRIPSAAGQVDAEALRGRWRNLKDTHDFFPMIRDFGLTRVQANAAVGDEFAQQVPVAAFEALLHAASADKTPIMIFVGNRGCIQIHTGPVQRVERMGEWLNVLDPGFNLHLRTDRIDSVWIVRKPTIDGMVTSMELFDADGEEVALLFGERKPGKPELESWRNLVNRIVA